MAVQIQSRRDTAANWTSNNPTLASGEIGIETDTEKFKFGDGATAWTALGYIDTAVDWTVTQSPAVIHASNYTDTNTTYISSDFTHDSLTGVTANEHLDWTTDRGATNIHAGNYTDTDTQLVEADITTMGFTKDVEVDWTVSQAPAVVHADNYTDTDNDTTAHASFSQLDYASAGHTGFAAALGADDNYVTNAEKTVIGNTSGANTGDQAITPEGTAVLSTGPVADTQYLRADGDGTCSWQAVAGGGDVTAGANLTDETLVQGDGGAKGVKTSTATVAQIASNVTHTTGDGSDHADVVTNSTKVTNATHTGDVTGATTLTIGADKVLDTHINWGTAATQISAVDLLIADAGTIITATEVEGALQENRTAIDLNTAKDTDVDHNVSTDLSLGAVDATTMVVASSDGTDATLIEADTTDAGLLGAAKWDEIVANSLKETDVDHNVTTNLSLGVGNATTEVVACSDGTDCTLIEADTDNAGLLGADKWDEIVANTLKDTNVSTDLSMGTVDGTQYNINSSDGNNVSLSLATTDAWGIISDEMFDALHTAGTDPNDHAQNADTALGAQSEDLDMNTHQVTGLDAPAANNEAIRQTAKITEAKMEAADDHVNDNTQAHTDYLLNSGSDTTSGTITAAGFTTTGVTLTGDHGTAATDQVVNVSYGTGSPPTANTTTIGSLFFKYTA